MGIKPRIFQSGDKATQHYLPGAYSRLDYIVGTGGLVSVNNGVILGDCRGGEPNKVLWFGSPTEASEVLRAGKLLDAIKHAFNPGGGYVPQRIGAWRVNPGTQSTYAYKSGAETMINGKAIDYGLHTNQIKTKLESGTSQGKKLTIKFLDNDEEIFDNVYRESFEIQYTGVGTASTMDITKTAITTSCTEAPEDNLNVLFSNYETIEQVVNYINDHAAYTCTMKDTVKTRASSHLDSVSSQDIKTSAYIAKSILQAIIDEMNKSAWATGSYNDSATARNIPDNVTTWAYYSGAVDGSYGSTEWNTSLSLAESEDIQFISTPSEDASIHSLIKAHCEKMNSTTGKNERQFIVGGATSETIAQVKTRASNLASDAGMIAYPGFKHYDFDDYTKIKTWSPAYYASKILGLVVSLAIQEPITNKSVDVLSWDKKLTITETEELIKAGICAGIASRSGRLVNARGITTYQGDVLQRNEFSMMRIALFVSRDLRTSIEDSFVGRAMSNSMLGRVDAIVIGKLSEYYDLGLFNGSPPYWGYKKTIIGDVIKIDYDCYLTPPTNFIFITSHMHVYASVNA